MLGSCGCPGSRMLFPGSAQALPRARASVQSAPSLRMFIRGLIWGTSFHTSVVKRGVNCTDLGEMWLFPDAQGLSAPQMPGRM